MNKHSTPEVIYERLLEAGVAEPGVTCFGQGNQGGTFRCVAGRWVPTGVLGVHDVVLSGTTKALEVLAEAATWDALDGVLDVVLPNLQPEEPTSPSIQRTSPSIQRTLDYVVDAEVVTDCASVPPPDEPSESDVRAIESQLIRTHGAEPIERS